MVHQHSNQSHPPVIEPSSVKVDSATKSVVIGSKVNIVASVLPIEADQRLTYKSADDTKATVSATGEVIGAAEGTVKVTVSSKAKSTIKTEVTITVTAASK